MPRRVLTLELSAAQLMLHQHLLKSKHQALCGSDPHLSFYFHMHSKNPNAWRSRASLLAFLETS